MTAAGLHRTLQIFYDFSGVVYIMRNEISPLVFQIFAVLVCKGGSFVTVNLV